MSSSENTAFQGQLSIQTALDIARNSEGDVEPTISAYLDACLQDVWAKLAAEPDSYIMTKDEFAVLNYFRPRFTDSEIAQSAIRRFWEHYEANKPG